MALSLTAGAGVQVLGHAQGGVHGFATLSFLLQLPVQEIKYANAGAFVAKSGLSLGLLKSFTGADRLIFSVGLELGGAIIAWLLSGVTGDL